MCMLFHRNSINYYPQKGKGQPDLSDWPLILCRQRPTLPHTFACSTIGPAGLNCRVRDGNGWIPRGKITDNLRRLASVNEPPTRRRLGACCRNPEPCLCSSRRRIQNAKLDACPF